MNCFLPEQIFLIITANKNCNNFKACSYDLVSETTRGMTASHNENPGFLLLDVNNSHRLLKDVNVLYVKKRRLVRLISACIHGSHEEM